uniref:Uncharacterized protein n=1 Tax=Micrurus lemniscatus lemniscatus TaxID=129467 RepID=A0A2D4IY96_MICLE
MLTSLQRCHLCSVVDWTFLLVLHLWLSFLLVSKYLCYCPICIPNLPSLIQFSGPVWKHGWVCLWIKRGTEIKGVEPALYGNKSKLNSDQISKWIMQLWWQKSFTAAASSPGVANLLDLRDHQTHNFKSRRPLI